MNVFVIFFGTVSISIFSMSEPSQSWWPESNIHLLIFGAQYQIHASDKAMKIFCLFYCLFSQTLQHDSDPFIGALLHKALEILPKQVLEMDQDKEFQDKSWEKAGNYGWQTNDFSVYCKLVSI